MMIFLLQFGLVKRNEMKNAPLSENMVFGDESNRFVIPPQIYPRLTARTSSAAGRT